jgi:hypothetical protein
MVQSILCRYVVDVHREYWPVLNSEEQEGKLKAAFKSTQVVGKQELY